jgi:hypothetical protein
MSGWDDLPVEESSASSTTKPSAWDNLPNRQTQSVAQPQPPPQPQGFWNRAGKFVGDIGVLVNPISNPQDQLRVVSGVAKGLGTTFGGAGRLAAEMLPSGYTEAWKRGANEISNAWKSNVEDKVGTSEAGEFIGEQLPYMIPVGRGVQVAQTLGGSIRAGAKIGALVGGAAGLISPSDTTNSNDYWKERGQRTAAGIAGGALLGGSAPIAIEGASKAVRLGKAIPGIVGELRAGKVQSPFKNLENAHENLQGAIENHINNTARETSAKITSALESPDANGVVEGQKVVDTQPLIDKINEMKVNASQLAHADKTQIIGSLDKTLEALESSDPTVQNIHDAAKRFGEDARAAGNKNLIQGGTTSGLDAKHARELQKAYWDALDETGVPNLKAATDAWKEARLPQIQKETGGNALQQLTQSANPTQKAQMLLNGDEKFSRNAYDMLDEASRDAVRKTHLHEILDKVNTDGPAAAEKLLAKRDSSLKTFFPEGTPEGDQLKGVQDALSIAKWGGRLGTLGTAGLLSSAVGAGPAMHGILAITGAGLGHGSGLTKTYGRQIFNVMQSDAAAQIRAGLAKSIQSGEPAIQKSLVSQGVNHWLSQQDPNDPNLSQQIATFNQKNGPELVANRVRPISPSNAVKTIEDLQQTRKGERGFMANPLSPFSPLSPITKNASGESAASMEAMSRRASERNQGQMRMKLDTRSGQITPLTGAEAVDVNAGKGEVIMMNRPNSQNWDVVSQHPSDKINKEAILVRHRAALNNKLKEML